MRRDMVMNRILFVSLMVLTPLIISACATSKATSFGLLAEKEVVPLAGEFKVHRYAFQNGLKLLVVEDHSSPTFAYQTWFRVGSRDESPGRTGLAHLFEHMMFKETKTLKDGEFDRILESSGAEGENAFTSRDYTAYIQEMPKDKFDLIARLESDRMVNLIINDKAFSTEREVVQNERRFRNENSPDGLMEQELFSLAFKKHPYHWPIIGYQEDLARMSSADALSFYKAHYSPNHATIIVVGDVDPSEAKSTIEKYYGSLPKQDSQPKTISAEPKQTSARSKNLKLNIQVEKLLMGFPVPAITHPDTAALNIIQNILTGGKSSRLNKALVETGIASTVGSYDIDGKDPSLFVIMANLQKDKKASQAEAVVLKEINRLMQQTVSQPELETAKNKLNFQFYQGLDSNFEKAYFLGHYESIAGGFEAGLRLMKQVQAVTADDVQKTVKRYLSSKTRTVITGVKK